MSSSIDSDQQFPYQGTLRSTTVVLHNAFVEGQKNTTMILTRGIRQMRARELSIGILISAAICAGLVNPRPSWAADEGVAIDVLGEGKLTVPAEFQQVQPQSRIVQHEFVAKLGEGDQTETARMTMMHAGGDVKENVRRWKGQFAGGDKAANRSEQLSVGKWTVHIVDLNGSYAERMGGGPFAGGKVVQRENYAMTGAIIVPADAKPESPKFFVKLIGPAAVVKANRQGMIDMVKSLQP